MKINLYLPLILLSFLYVSCNNDNIPEEYEQLLVATPVKMSLTEFRESVTILPPTSILVSGKIYAYEDYIFINDKNTGVHVIDNSVPLRPIKVAFIKIPGNVDISVKGDFLYADSMMDLLVFNISDIANITLENRLKDVLQAYTPFPEGAEWYNWDDFNYAEDIIVGWTLKEEMVLKEKLEPDVFLMESLASQSVGQSTGQGGSLARFKIVSDYLYAVDSHTIHVIDIEDLANPVNVKDVSAGFDIETIFNQGNHLYLGSMQGMYIYNISVPDNPTFISQFQHGTACDPVVVDGETAYITLRGGNLCGAIESGLFVIDVKDLSSPNQIAQYNLDNPYGLGVQGDLLFVCDGTSGLRVFNKKDPKNLVQIQHLKDINSFDVIPLEKKLLLIGSDKLHQFSYIENGIEPLSVLEMN